MERSERNRIRELDSFIRLVEKKATKEDTHKTIFRSLGITNKQYERMENGESRGQVVSRKINRLIEVFTDNEYGNYYRVPNILKGKVKAFKGRNAKERLIDALEQAKEFHG